MTNRQITRALTVFLGLLGVVAWPPFDAASADDAKRVALFQYADSPLHEMGVGGMIEGLAAKGYVVGDNLMLTQHNALRDTETAAAIAQEIASGSFDVILTSGTQALQAVTQANQGGETVQVFGLVADPFSAGVGLDADDLLSHPDHLVGVGSFPPVDPIFELARELYSDLKSVGVVWNPDESNSQEGMARARDVASALGIDLMEATAKDFDEVGAAAATLVANGADVLWIGADNTVHHAADAVIAAAAEGGIPVMSSLPGDAERGALVDLSHDWREVGKTVGAMAGDILAGTDPRSIAIEVHPDRLKLILNEAALAGLKAPWRLPDDVVSRADEVIE